MNKKIIIVGIIIVAVIAVLLIYKKQQPTANNPSPAPVMKITSSAFSEGGSIPEKYTCKAGDPVNPELKFSDVPKGAKSLALIMHDPDAPLAGGFTHWVIYNMPAETAQIPENSKPPGVEGKNGKNTNEYIGPCPPSGTHRYYFYLYALDIELPDSSDLTKTGLENAIYPYILEQAQLMVNFSS